MAISEDRIRLLLDIIGTADVKQLNEALEGTGVRLNRVKEAGDKAATAIGKGGGGATGFGQSLLQAGRGIQDFQAAGLMGVINNIEGLAIALGGGAGLAGILTAVAVGFQVLGPHLRRFFADLTSEAPKAFTDEIARMKAQVEELKKTDLTITTNTTDLDAAERKLKGLTAAKQAFDALMGKRTPEEEEAGRRVTARLAEAGGQEALAGRVRAGVEARMMAAAAPGLAPLDAELRAAEANLARVKAEGLPQFRVPAEERLRRAQAARGGMVVGIQGRAQARTEELFAEAMQGRPGGIADLVGALRRGGVGGGLPQELLLMDPAKIAAERRAAAEKKAAEDRDKEMDKQVKEATAAAQKDAAAKADDARELAEQAKSRQAKRIEIVRPRRVERIPRLAAEGDQGQVNAQLLQNQAMLTRMLAALVAGRRGDGRQAAQIRRQLEVIGRQLQIQ